MQKADCLTTRLIYLCTTYLVGAIESERMHKRHNGNKLYQDTQCVADVTIQVHGVIEVNLRRNTDDGNCRLVRDDH